MSKDLKELRGTYTHLYDVACAKKAEHNAPAGSPWSYAYFHGQEDAYSRCLSEIDKILNDKMWGERS